MANIDDEFDSERSRRSPSAPPPPISPRSPKRPAITPATPARTTPSAPMTPIGGSSPPGCAGKGSIPCPRTRKPSASISPPAWRESRGPGAAERRRRWSAGSPAFVGITASAASRSTQATGIFRPCSPAFAAPMAARRSKRRRSSPMNCWRCWRRSRWICAGSATAPFWRSVSPAACAVRKSSASIAAPIRARTGPAGSRFCLGADVRAPGDSRCFERSNNDGGAVLQISGKTGWREVEIGRGSRPETCPVALLETWMRLGRISQRPSLPPDCAQEWRRVAPSA